MSSSTVSAWRRGAVAAAALAVIGLGAACSTEATPDAGNVSEPGGGAAVEVTGTGDHEAFAQCLSDNGVPAPLDGGPGGPGGEPPVGPPPFGGPGEGRTPPAPPNVDQGVWESAMQACQPLAPTPPVS
ncbi:hypothetical protein [Mycolicibacterium mengxianglii]|uniref:hypothetical protein n=1 Tax=Mycolicibacterium mengxianglii TaxID=2736649 RepID=UPI001E47E589|nr:hypothetical protein [Mycolicibacterium mengxianglii]